MSEVNPARVSLLRRLIAEAVGTGLLVTVVVGSGIAAEQLSPGNNGLQLLENSTATVFGLAVLILMFGPVSGAHFNPVVTAADWLWAAHQHRHQRDTCRPLHRRPDHRRHRRGHTGQRTLPPPRHGANPR